MNIDIIEYNKLKLMNEELLIKNKELEDKLKSYTNNNRHKKYYENNADAIKEKSKNYMEKIKETNPENGSTLNEFVLTARIVDGKSKTTLVVKSVPIEKRN